MKFIHNIIILLYYYKIILLLQKRKCSVISSIICKCIFFIVDKIITIFLIIFLFPNYNFINSIRKYILYFMQFILMMLLTIIIKRLIEYVKLIYIYFKNTCKFFNYNKQSKFFNYIHKLKKLECCINNKI